MKPKIEDIKLDMDQLNEKLKSKRPKQKYYFIRSHVDLDLLKTYIKTNHSALLPSEYPDLDGI